MNEEPKKEVEQEIDPLESDAPVGGKVQIAGNVCVACEA